MRTRQPGPVRAGRRHGQGYVVLALALIGVTSAALFALPIIESSTSALSRHRAERPPSGLLSVVEYVLWKIQYEPGFIDTLEGSPPSTEIVVDAGDGPADVTVQASSDPPEDNGLAASIFVSPSLVAPETPTEVTYTLTITNSDSQPHYVSRVDSNPIAWHGDFVAGSTSGVTALDPVWTAGEWRWILATPIAIPPWGGSAWISWRVLVDEDEGNYWTAHDVQFSDVGPISAPMPGAVRSLTLGDIDIVSSVTPSVVIAGSPQTYSYTIVVTNVGDEDLHVERVKHYTTTNFEYVDGSTSGATTNNPHRNHDVQNDRWEHIWTFNEVLLQPGQSLWVSADFLAALLPGWFMSTSGVLVDEDESSNGQEDTANTGDASPIISMHGFVIHVDHDSGTADVIATMSSTGLDVTSWVEDFSE